VRSGAERASAAVARFAVVLVFAAELTLAPIVAAGVMVMAVDGAMADGVGAVGVGVVGAGALDGVGAGLTTATGIGPDTPIIPTIPMDMDTRPTDTRRRPITTTLTIPTMTPMLLLTGLLLIRRKPIRIPTIDTTLILLHRPA
jgi:hypothetical protein